MNVMDEIKRVKGVTDASIIEMGTPAQDPVSQSALLLYNIGKQITTAAKLGEFQQVTLNTVSGRGLALAHGTKLIGLMLTENASPMLVSKQVRGILEKG